MAELKFTRDDREYLRSIHIDPKPSVAETMEDVLFSSPGPGCGPTTFVISAELAREVVKEYGELNWENFQRYLMSKGKVS